MSFVIASALSRLSKTLGERQSDRRPDQVRKAILEALLDAGFDRARFYGRCEDLAHGMQEILVLVTQAARPSSGKPKAPLGYPVPVATASPPDAREVAPGVMIADASDFSDPMPWIDDLDLADRTWIDIRLQANGDPVGVVAIDWVGRKDDISPDQLEQLSGIGLMVGAHLQLRQRHRVGDLRTAVRTEGKAGPSANVVLSEGMRTIARMMDARLAAVFEYHWSSGLLTKRFELDGLVPDAAQRSDEILTGEETYAVGNHLTGKAWTDPRYRHAPLFRAIEEDVRDLIELGSMERHEAHLRRAPSTLLYGYVDGLEPRFLLRMMDRVGPPAVPYVSERDLLDELLNELRVQLDKAIAMDRTRNLEMATGIAADLIDPFAVVEELAPLLAQEDVTDFLLLCHRPPSTQFNFGVASGKELKDIGVLAGREWEESWLYTRAIEAAPSLALLDLTTAVRAGDAIARMLRAKGHSDPAKGYRSVLALPMTAGETQGALLIPLPADTPVRRGSLVDDCGAGRLSLLGAYARLLGDAVDHWVASRKADGAREALGLLGHELATPVARLGSTAEAALTTIGGHVAESQRLHENGDHERGMEESDEVRVVAASYLEKVKLERRHVGAAIRLAPIVAQEANGTLDVQFEEFNLARMVREAVAIARLEANDGTLADQDDGARRSHLYHFQVGTGVDSLGRTRGDETLLMLALLNILRNAAKYTIPTRGAPPPIEILGERQRPGSSRRPGMRIVLVRNVGSHISPEQRDLIFEPWVRLRDSNGGVARRGMGLGLFLSRRIAFAHSGTVLCRNSVPLTANALERLEHAADSELESMLSSAFGSQAAGRRRPSGLASMRFVERRSSLPQRFLTEFEIRIPDDLAVGPHVHKWKERTAMGTVTQEEAH